MLELDARVLDLQAIRMELNAVMEELKAKQKVLVDFLKERWNSDRIAEYQKKIDIINHGKLDANFEKYRDLDAVHEMVISSMSGWDLLTYKKLKRCFSTYVNEPYRLLVDFKEYQRLNTTRKSNMTARDLQAYERLRWRFSVYFDKPKIQPKIQPKDPSKYQPKDTAESRLNAGFKEYQKLRAVYVKAESNMKAQDLQKYKELKKYFSAYLSAIEDGDVVLVRNSQADNISIINECTQKMMKVVAEYEVCMLGIVAMVEVGIELTDRGVEQLKRALHLYAITFYKKVVESMPRLLLSERLIAVTEMKKNKLFVGCDIMDLLKSDWIHLVHGYTLSDHKLQAGALTAYEVNMYKHQNTDMTRPQIVATLKDTYIVIRDSVVNCVIVENLASICAGTASEVEIEDEINQKLAKVLTGTPDVDRDNMGELYDISVDPKSGCIISGDAKIVELKVRFIRIRQEHDGVRIQYVTDNRGFSYSEYSASVVRWAGKEDARLDGVLLEPAELA